MDAKTRESLEMGELRLESAALHEGLEVGLGAAELLRDRLVRVLAPVHQPVVDPAVVLDGLAHLVDPTLAPLGVAKPLLRPRMGRSHHTNAA